MIPSDRTQRPREWDGGLTALAGYLYQIVGLLGLQAAGESPDLSPSTPELTALLTIIRDPATLIQHEYLDNDGVLRQLGVTGEDRCVLVQFKYSRKQPPEPFQTSDLVKIAAAFAESTTRATERGYTVTGYVLLTNRVDGPRLTVAPPDLPTDQAHILQHLLRVRNIPLDEWRQRLERFAADYGCLPQEIRRGLNELVGQVFQETGSGTVAAIEPAMLQRAFTQLSRADPITYAAVALTIQQELTTLRDEQGWTPSILCDGRSWAKSRRCCRRAPS